MAITELDCVLRLAGDASAHTYVCERMFEMQLVMFTANECVPTDGHVLNTLKKHSIW